jgi:hypothetical protein
MGVHVNWYPLLRSPTVRKFMVGYELLAMRSATYPRGRQPNACAVSEKHYLDQ